jgi:hypothetical protein
VVFRFDQLFVFNSTGKSYSKLPQNLHCLHLHDIKFVLQTVWSCLNESDDLTSKKIENETIYFVQVAQDLWIIFTSRS